METRTVTCEKCGSPISPEAVAFFEACSDYWLCHRVELDRVDEMPDGRWKRMALTYREMLAAQEKGKPRHVLTSALALIWEQGKEIAALRSERLRLLGYISATPDWSDKHPGEVVKWWEEVDVGE